MAGEICGLGEDIPGAAPRTVAVERLNAGDHACLWFGGARGEEERWALRAAYAIAGITRGERVVFFVEPGTEGEGLDRLASFGVPMGGTVGGALGGSPGRPYAAGRVEVVGTVPGYVPGRGLDNAARIDHWVTLTRQSAALGFAGVRAAGDMGWASSPEVGSGQLTAYEVALTPVLAKLRLAAMCEYDRERFPAERYDGVLAAHPLHVLPLPGALHASREGDVLRLSGDADLATRFAFEDAVRDAVRQPGLTAIDLTGLAFIDAYCVRALLRLGAGVALECTAAQHRLLGLCGVVEVRTEPAGRPTLRVRGCGG
ncbi:MEDS domain-containing protein [Streptomyces sp. NBC_01476]|uniref:MEDS domain-containing protein n=1 Tax=Streptomyces sp. NBC_01476 TaxID=2903881 RepID=UPI002E362A67|nr:MEDS domain-containing protein [Streptomyces sp. NBC_01476]